MAKQRRPTGVARPITPDFKEAVRRKMRRLGMNQTELATAVGVTPGAITVFFRPRTRTCRFVEELVRVLKLQEPEFLDERDAEVVRDVRRYRQIFPSDYDRMAAEIRAALEEHEQKARGKR